MINIVDFIAEIAEGRVSHHRLAGKYLKQEQWLDENMNRLLALNIESAYAWAGEMSFRVASHDAAIKFMLAFPGEWEKVYNETTIDYLQSLPDFTLKVTGSPPPPNCRIVEEDEVVPAVPEHVKKVRRIVCQDDPVETTTE